MDSFNFNLDSLLTLSLVVKGSTIAILVLLAFQFARMRGIRGLVGGLLVASVCCYILLQFVRSPDRPLWLLPIHLGALTVSFWLYLFSKLLFSDEDRIDPVVWVVPIFLLILGTAAFFNVSAAPADRSVFESALILGPRLISLGLIGVAIVTIYRDDAGDLVQARRRFRKGFVLSVGVTTASILVLEIYMRGQCPPVLLDFVTSIGILLVSFVVSCSVLTLEPFLLFSTIPLKARSLEPELSPEESEIQSRLLAFMADQSGFKEESLTIRSLAAKLSVHEYKLRRLINLRLGFRNFNDYLNDYRITAACDFLVQTTNADVPILRLAMDLGYGSIAPFNRAFRTRTGKSPTQ